MNNTESAAMRMLIFAERGIARMPLKILCINETPRLFLLP